MAIYQLDDDLWFPDPHQGESDGWVAVGGDLSADRLLLAYSNGFFPWFSFRHHSEPCWYCPLDRFVIFPDEIHISHSLRQVLRQHRYEVTVNQDFEGVINGCSTAQDRHCEEGAWLGAAMIEAYVRLHRMGYASSVEVWEPSGDGTDRTLVGGLYGVTLCRSFFGESMFSLRPNASKVALASLARMMSARGGGLIDCQFETPFFQTMGGRYISYEEYMRVLHHE